MFCPNCGREIKINETFCSNCGAKIVNGKAVFDKPKPATVVHAEQDKENAIVSLVCGIVLGSLYIIISIVLIVFIVLSSGSATY